MRREKQGVLGVVSAVTQPISFMYNQFRFSYPPRVCDAELLARTNGVVALDFWTILRKPCVISRRAHPHLHTYLARLKVQLGLEPLQPKAPDATLVCFVDSGEGDKDDPMQVVWRTPLPSNPDDESWFLSLDDKARLFLYFMLDKKTPELFPSVIDLPESVLQIIRATYHKDDAYFPGVAVLGRRVFSSVDCVANLEVNLRQMYNVSFGPQREVLDGHDTEVLDELTPRVVNDMNLVCLVVLLYVKWLMVDLDMPVQYLQGAVTETLALLLGAAPCGLPTSIPIAHHHFIDEPFEKLRYYLRPRMLTLSHLIFNTFDPSEQHHEAELKSSVEFRFLQELFLRFQRLPALWAKEGQDRFQPTRKVEHREAAVLTSPAEVTRALVQCFQWRLAQYVEDTQTEPMRALLIRNCDEADLAATLKALSWDNYESSVKFAVTHYDHSADEYVPASSCPTALLTGYRDQHAEYGVLLAPALDLAMISWLSVAKLAEPSTEVGLLSPMLAQLLACSRRVDPRRTQFRLLLQTFAAQGPSSAMLQAGQIESLLRLLEPLEDLSKADPRTLLHLVAAYVRLLRARQLQSVVIGTDHVLYFLKLVAGPEERKKRVLAALPFKLKEKTCAVPVAVVKSVVFPELVDMACIADPQTQAWLVVFVGMIAAEAGSMHQPTRPLDFYVAAVPVQQLLVRHRPAANKAPCADRDPAEFPFAHRSCITMLFLLEIVLRTTHKSDLDRWAKLLYPRQLLDGWMNGDAHGMLIRDAKAIEITVKRGSKVYSDTTLYINASCHDDAILGGFARILMEDGVFSNGLIHEAHEQFLTNRMYESSVAVAMADAKDDQVVEMQTDQEDESDGDSSRPCKDRPRRACNENEEPCEDRKKRQKTTTTAVAPSESLDEELLQYME